MGSFDIYRALDLLPGIILGLTVHEFAHAWMADHRGDPTARKEGRLTLDPAKHIDPLGLILLFVVGFGWAKPVMFRPENLRNPIKDPRWVAAAGPAANVVTAVVLTLVFVALKKAVPWAQTSFDSSLMKMLLLAILTNWGLAVFNLIPLPPLDGSHILFPRWTQNSRQANLWARYGNWGLFAVILVQNNTKLTLLPVGPAVHLLAQTTLGWFGVTIGF